MALVGSDVVSWGRGCNGQLGDGSGRNGGEVCSFLSSAYVPVETAGSLGYASLISGGGEDSLVYGRPRPTVAHVAPHDGLDKGGEEVTITGTELSETTAVHFGSVDAPSFTVDSEESITAISPPESEGKVSVTVTTASGESVPVIDDYFRYHDSFPQPVATALKPAKGPAEGGTSVTIVGSGFEGPLEVHFGSTRVAATANTAFPAHLIVTSPPGSGDVPVSVTTLGGTSAQNAHTVFKYGAPTISGISPDSGPVSGGTSVTITGTGFAPGIETTSFKFSQSYATSVECSSTTTCTAVTPAHKGGKPGTVDVRAVVGKLKSKPSPPADRFSYT